MHLVNFSSYTRLLDIPALSPEFVRELWNSVNSVSSSTGKEIPLLDLISWGNDLSIQEASAITPQLSMLSSLLSSILCSVHDEEFYGAEG